MLLKQKQDIQNLFEYVHKFKKENKSIYDNIQQELDDKVNIIKQDFCNVDQKIIKNYASQITALKIIDSTLQDLKVSLEISTLNMSSNRKKNALLIQQEERHNVKVLQSKIQALLNGIQELDNIEDIEIRQNQELLGINVFRLNQIYQNEVENLQCQFQLLTSYNNERFTKLNQSFEDIINQKKFKKIKNQIQVYQEICNMLDQYKESIIQIIQKQQDSYIIDRTKSLQSLDSVSDFTVEGHYEIKKGKSKQFPEEIKNKRKESSSETCVNCLIF